ncbi:hypothetical protein, partial [Nisaea nitritireducens]|uniref:hypothetical protein n=1 Tax=Nisaea nitritireducens TaxID=568392 RepID=UPI001D01E900
AFRAIIGAKGLYFYLFQPILDWGPCFLTRMIETVIRQALEIAINAQECWPASPEPPIDQKTDERTADRYGFRTQE